MAGACLGHICLTQTSLNLVWLQQLLPTGKAAVADCSQWGPASRRPPGALTNATGWRDAGARRRPQAVCALGSLIRQPCHLLLHQVAIDAFALHQHLRRTVFADLSRLQHDDPIEIAQA